MKEIQQKNKGGMFLLSSCTCLNDLLMFKRYNYFHPNIHKACGKHLLLWICGKTFSGGSMVKNPPANAGDTGSIPASGNPLEKEMVTLSSRKATVYGVEKGLDTT